MKVIIGIVGDFNENFESHIRLNESLIHVKQKMDWDFDYEWIDTVTVESEGAGLLRKYNGIWSAPGSPFQSLKGATTAIHYARINNIPHLGTCGGFQHTIIEFAQNVLGIEGAQHEEYDPASSVLFISRLACSLAGKKLKILLNEGSVAYTCYGLKEIEENYYCNFGINPIFKEKLAHPSLLVSGVDDNQEIRIIEVPHNDFFVATLFVPQINSTFESPHPIIMGFVKACLLKSIALK